MYQLYYYPGNANLAPHILLDEIGADYRAVDAYLLMLCRWTRVMHKPARSRPHLARVLDAVMARPATQRAFAAEGIAAPYY